jgi:hypothetical protein
MAFLSAFCVVIACVGALALGSVVAWRSLCPWKGAELGMLVRGLVTILGSLMLGFLGGSWGEELLGTRFGVPSGVFAGCLIGALVFNSAMGAIGAFFTKLFRWANHPFTTD